MAAEQHEIAALLAELSGTLANEREALRLRDSERLEAAVAHKAALVAALETATGNFCRNDPARAAADLAGLRELAVACARANRVNGGAIELNRNLVERLLDTLRGVRPTPVYDASGQLNRRETQRAVARV